VPTSPASPLLWFAVLGAPAAWSGQFGILYWVTEADCRGPEGRWGIDLDVWAIVITIPALALCAAALTAAVWLFRSSGDAEEDDAPPAGRIYFLSVVGIAINPLFTVIIALNCAGLLAHDCGIS
jgi:heme/copper-type cytochrome/quinol oxidase subunit 2